MLSAFSLRALCSHRSSVGRFLMRPAVLYATPVPLRTCPGVGQTLATRLMVSCQSTLACVRPHSMARGLVIHRSRCGALQQGYGWHQLRPSLLWHGFNTSRQEDEDEARCVPAQQGVWHSKNILMAVCWGALNGAMNQLVCWAEQRANKGGAECGCSGATSAVGAGDHKGEAGIPAGAAHRDSG